MRVFLMRRTQPFAILRSAVTSLACAVFAAALLAPSGAAVAQLGRAAQTPQSMLDHGLYALEENQPAAARKIFETLMAKHPGTVEAGRAALELEVMNAQTFDAGDQPLAPSVQMATVRLAEIRREFLLEVGDRVFFAQMSSDIGGRARTMLDHQARWLKKHPDLIVTVIGRADDGGSAQDAASLSTQRAEAVRQRLVSGGVDARRILIDARGASDPLAVCRSALCQAQNRHAETVIGDPKQAGDPRSTAR